MSEKNESPDIAEVLQLIATELGKSNDILMMILNESNPEQAELVDFIHNKRYLFMSELSEDELTVLVNEFREYKYGKQD